MPIKSIKKTIDAPATVNKVSSVKLLVDPQKGENFRCALGSHISVPDLDALATGDKIQFQISTQDQNEASALYEIDSEYEVYTFARTITFTQRDTDLEQDPNKKLMLDEGIDGLQLASGKDYYLNSLITGQDGAIPMKVHLRGNHTNNPDADDMKDMHNEAI